MAIEVAGVVARLGFRVDDDGAQRFERKMRDLRGDAKRDVVVPLRGDMQPRDLDLYAKKLDEIRRRVRRKEDFKAALGADYDARAFNAYERDLRKAERATNDNVKSSGRLKSAFAGLAGGAAMGGVGAAATGIGVAVAGVGVAMGKTVTLAADFQQQMDRLGAVAGATGKQMEQLERQAIKAGAGTKFSALEAAAAQTELVKGGLALDDVLSGGLNAALGLAAAGEMDLAMAGETAVYAMKLFNIEGRDAGHVADALATAANSTTADVSDFALALKQGGSAAKAAGYDLDQTVVALELLAENGIKGSDAGTSLKAMFAQLAAPTEEQAGLMEKLNVNFFDARGEIKSVADISAMLRDRMKGMTKEQELNTVKTLAGTDGMRAMLAMYGAGPKKIEALSKGLREQGTAAEVAAKKQDNLRGKWENLMGSLETLGIQVGTKLLPHLEKATEWTTKFVNEMSSGEGSGGKFARALEKVWSAIKTAAHWFNEAQKAGDRFESWVHRARDNIVKWIGDAMGDIVEMGSGVIGVFADIAEAGAKIKIPGMKDVAKDLRDMERDLDKTAASLHGLGDEANKIDMGKVRKENRQTARAFAEMAKDGGGSMRDISRVTDRRTREIKKSLGEHSEEGGRALADNFRQAMGAVRRQMAAGETTTERGLRKIRGYLAAELDVYGLEIAQGQKLVGKHPFADKKAGGGWIGGPGQVGQDTVPAMLAPGEAVLNRHQQAVVEGLLGGGFLDRLFSNVSTPHYMARGGIVPVPGFPGESAAQSVIPKILQIARQFGLTLTDAFGPGHQSPGHTRFGTAADFAGPDRSMNAAVRSLTRAGYLVGYDGRYGSQDWAGHGPAAGQGGSNAHLHVELGGKGGNIGGLIGRLKRVVVRGGGQVGRVVQGALDVGRAGAQEFAERTANASAQTPMAGGGSGGAARQGRIASRWRSVNPGVGDPRLMSAIAMAESSGVATANGPPDGRGWYQIEWPVWGRTLGKFGNPYNGRANTRMAREVLQKQGLGAWVAFTTGRHRQFMARGGRAGFRGSQAVTNAAANAAEGAARYAIGRPDRRLRRRAHTRIGS
jgi:TP901 family phage tail tape measure protein